MDSQFVVLEKSGHIATIRLNRPNEMNALNYETLCRLGDLVEELHSQTKETRAVIITGTGRAFCAGADLKERRHLTEDQVRRNVKKIRDVFTAIERLPQPTIAAINGFAYGGGLELALACDFRFAVQSASMGLTEVSLGIIPGAGGTQRMARLIGPAKAKELILTARKLSADEACVYGLLTGVTVSLESLQEATTGLSQEILQNAPLAVYQAKFAIDKGSQVELQSGLEIETKAYEVIIPTKDRLEALEAFREKRKPNFKGE